MMKKLILAFLMISPAAYAGEDYRPGMEYAAVLEGVSTAGVTIDGHFYLVPGGTLLKRGSGKKQVKYQLKAGERVLFAIRPGKKGQPSNVLSFIEPQNSILDEAE